MLKLITKPLGALFLLGVVCLCGLYAAMTLDVSLFPSISKPNVYASIRVPGENSKTIELTYSKNIKQALLESVRIRFRPILMTVLTTVLAMLPIAMNLGSGGKPLQPLGIAVSGGLITSTAFTIIIVPLLIFIFEKDPAKESV